MLVCSRQLIVAAAVILVTSEARAQSLPPEAVALQQVRTQMPTGAVVFDTRVVVPDRKARADDERFQQEFATSLATSIDARIADIESVRTCDSGNRCRFQGVSVIMSTGKAVLRADSTAEVLVRARFEDRPGQRNSSELQHHLVSLKRRGDQWAVVSSKIVMVAR